MQAAVCKVIAMQPPRLDDGGLLFASGITVPTDAAAGYATGCLFQHTDGTTGTAFYVNEGSVTSCDFNAVAALTAAQEALLLTAGQQSLLVAITATAAELNQNDLSAKTDTATEATKATAITAGSRYVKITGGTGYTGLVLPVPTAAEVGLVKQITLDTISSGAVAITITNVAIGGTQATTATFDAAGETLVVIGAVYGTTFRWIVLKEHGVTLS